jgi:signal transduction histidine kinase
VRDGTQQALNIVSTLRQCLREEARGEPVDHRRFCEAGVKAAGPDLRHKEIKIELALADLPKVLCSEKAMEIIVSNLVANAAHAIAESGSIRIESTQVSGRCRITIQDDGAGMAPEVLERMFEPFFTTKGPGHGLGLGLALCRTLLHKQGGEIGAQSAPGKGTIVAFELPLESP